MKKRFFAMALAAIAATLSTSPISAQGTDSEPVQRAPIHTAPRRPPTRIVRRPKLSSLSVIERYDTWTRDDGTVFNDAISLVPENFSNQIFANAHTVYTPDGDVLLVGYGDVSFSGAFAGTTPCDAVYVINWKTDGTYNVPALPALPYGLPGHVNCGITGVNGGGPIGKSLGAGMGTAQAGGNYYGILPTATPENGESWMTWTTSPDGINWKFYAEGGGFTDDPEKAVKLIRRADMTKGLFGHSAMVYHAPWFYMAICVWTDGTLSKERAYVILHTPQALVERQAMATTWLAEGGAIITTWWRFDGVSRLEILNGQDWLPSNGILPDDLSQAVSPTGAVDPLDLQWVGDKLLLVYATDFNQDPPTFSYVFGGYPDDSGLSWGPSKKIDMGDFWTEYVGCGSGGGINLAWRDHEWYGFVAARKRDLTPCNPNGGAQGLVRVKLEIK